MRHGAESAWPEGADVLDIGDGRPRPSGRIYGEGRQRDLRPTTSSRRVLPVIERLRAETDKPISIDTRKSKVAAAALKGGARYVNDVSAGTFDPEILRVAADLGAVLVLRHSRGTPGPMAEPAQCYEDLVGEVRKELGWSASPARH